ncbi:MAG TPA: DMT family transporter [Pyrinomonadaceae bacterium]|jgi:transporter family-2 protein|nr:DMT family transporter [Pyrinomonadaceae bacterium]
MSNFYLYLLLALTAGAMMPTQAAINNKLAGYVASPISAAFISFLVGTLGLLAYMLITGVPLSSLLNIKEVPPIAWIGGLMGAFFVTSAVILVPRIGVAMTFSLIVAGQMLITLVLDHFGFLGIPVKEISLARIGGILLITAGVVIIRRF